MFPHKISGNSLTFFGNGRMWSVSSDHANYEAIKEQLVLSLKGQNTLDMDGIIALYDERIGITKESDGTITFDGDTLLYKGNRLSNYWAGKINALRRANKPFKHLIGALESLMSNENTIMHERVPEFVEMQRLGFLPDGRIISFLVVTDQYTRPDSDNYVNKVGAKITPVGKDPLLVGAVGYMLMGQSYNFHLLPPNRKVMLVAFWPADVDGSKGQKLRVKEYEVLDEMDLTLINAFAEENRDVVSSYSEMEAAA